MKKVTAEASPSVANQRLFPTTPTGDIEAERRELARDLAILIRRKLRLDSSRPLPPAPIGDETANNP